MKRTLPWLVTILATACANEPVSTASLIDVDAPATTGALALDGSDLATLRRVTAPFRQFNVALLEGYSAQITGCMTDPLGGMGYHYGKPAQIDANVRLTKPEVLLYEPDSTGALQLVAVEYIVPVSAWTKAEPPRLFGRDFHVIPAFQVWALHVWLWKANPRGMFEDWNPNVNCDHASDVASMAHH
jgi:hypothetical protein